MKKKNIWKNLQTAVEKRKVQLVILFYTLFSPALTAYADPSSSPAPASTADAKWNAVIDFILPWIQRLGGVVILIGAVEFGLAFKSDDAEGKTKGLRTVIAGCIVFAVGLSSSIFLAP